MIKQMLTQTYYIGICDKCGKEFKGHFRYNPDGTYREQRYCSPECYAKNKIIIRPDKYIAHSIGGKITRLKHDLIAEQILNRPLKPGEVVHHQDHNKSNNDLNNLRVYHSQIDHAKHHNCNPLSVIEKQLEDGSYIVVDAIQVVDVITDENREYCQNCEKPFAKYHPNSKFCSKECRTEYHNKLRESKYGPGYSHKHVGKNAYLNTIS